MTQGTRQSLGWRRAASLLILAMGGALAGCAGPGFSSVGPEVARRVQVAADLASKLRVEEARSEHTADQRLRAVLRIANISDAPVLVGLELHFLDAAGNILNADAERQLAIIGLDHPYEHPEEALSHEATDFRVDIAPAVSH